MNESFVCIKVDREERPDVDKVYMTFVQATTGGGGWPMSVFLTPKLQPFFGGTYFPPEDSMRGRPGFKSLLRAIAGQWGASHEEVSTHVQYIKYVEIWLPSGYTWHNHITVNQYSKKFSCTLATFT